VDIEALAAAEAGEQVIQELGELRGVPGGGEILNRKPQQFEARLLVGPLKIGGKLVGLEEAGNRRDPERAERRD